MRFGLPISLTLHVLAVFAGMWVWANRPEPLQHDEIIPLKLTTVSDITNVSARRHKTKPKPKDIVSPPVSEPVQEKPKPVAKAKPEARPKAPPKAPAFDLDALEKALTTDTDKEQKTAEVIPLQNEIPTARQGEVNRMAVGQADADLVNAKDYIRSRLKSCWIVDTGVPDYDKLVVDIHLRLRPDGHIEQIEVLNAARIIASDNLYWDSARRNAENALRKCAPYEGLKTIDYRVWKDMTLHLDPGDGQ